MMNPEYGTGMVPREVPRLSVVLSSWVQKEVSAGGQEDVRKRGGGDAIRDEAGLKAPCYAPLFVRYKTLSTPPLVQQLKAQCKVSWQIKVFPQISRALALVDERIFLWNYNTSRDPTIYEASSVVTAVELTHPKPSVFEPHVHFVMVVATFSSIELVAVHVRDAQCNEICLQRLPDFQLTTGSTIMSCIASFEGRNSDSPPRTFLGGNDGCVYELQYQQTDGWVRSRSYLRNLSLVAGDVPVVGGLMYMARDLTASFFGYSGVQDLQIDHVRNYLYALDSKGYVHLWWLGPDGETTLSQFQCKQKAATSGVKAVSLHPLPRQKYSDHEVLYVLMQDGSRAMFSTSSSHDGRVRQLQPSRVPTSSNDLGTCPLKTFSQISLQPAEIGPLYPTFPMEQFGSLSAVDDSSGRSFVGSKSSLLIPKDHQAHPQLICTASIGIDGGSQGNVLSIVDLQPLIRQADSWRKGEIPTTGINIFSVIEEQWGGGVVNTLYASASDLVTQVVRPPPRFLVVHSSGITLLLRLRPVDLLHISLMHPGGLATGSLSGFAHSVPPSVKQLDFNWLLAAYGQVEVGVTLLTLICSKPDAAAGGAAAAGQAQYSFSTTGGPIEESVALAVSSAPSQDVVQRAREQFGLLGPAGTCALFQYFVRIVHPIWSLSFVSPAWEQILAKKQLSLFATPLRGFLEFLTQVAPAFPADLQHVYNPGTDQLHPNSMTSAAMLENESFSDLYSLLLQPQPMHVPRMDLETVAMVESLSRHGLRSIVERTVEALTILSALEDMSKEHRTSLITQIRGMELNRVVTSFTTEDAESFTDALVSELLALPSGIVDKVWHKWRACRTFFDPAAVDYYEARQRFVSPHASGNVNVIREAMAKLERPDIAPCLLRRQTGVASGPVRLETICCDMRRSRHYWSAMHLAMVAAKHCDSDNRAEYWHSRMTEPDAAHGSGGDANMRADIEHAHHFFKSRRIAYSEIIHTLDLLCGSDIDLEVSGANESATSLRAQRAAAIEWALGTAAAKYYDSNQKGLVRPVLAGELLGSQDMLLHYHLYAWIVSRPDGEGVWPSRSDISRVRPHRQPKQSAATSVDSLHQFLSAGHFPLILRSPLHVWFGQLVENWCRLWDGWHIGLLNDLADYCESQDQGCIASAARLTLAHAHSSMLLASPDFARYGQVLLPGRIEILVKAEASAQRDMSPNGRQLDQWLRSQRPSAIAGVQQQMLLELPYEAWDKNVFRQEREHIQAAAQDEAELSGELLPASKLYEMLHDSYDEGVPHLAIKLLRIMGIERPELKHLFTSTSAPIGPWKITDFINKLLERHRRLLDEETASPAALVQCFNKLQDAVGIDQGVVHHVESPFMPLQLVLSGLEEMAMKLADRRGAGLLPSGSLLDDKVTPVSIVPKIVGGALGWPNSRVLYDGYRQLWWKVDRGQTQDLFPAFRGSQMEDVKQRRLVVARLMAILGQFCVQWLGRHEQDLIQPQSDFTYQQLSREFPVFVEDIEQMVVTSESHPDIPLNVRQLLQACRHRLQAFSEQVQAVQPSGRRREW